MAGEHVMRHKPGIFNSLWSDMFIETTFMRYGHGPGGIIGITLQPDTVKRWALSLHLSSRLVSDLDQMENCENGPDITRHKEESKSRIQHDFLDRLKIREKLELCRDPLSTKDDNDQLVNIVTGQISHESVNVDKSVSLGIEAKERFESNLPSGFYSEMHKTVNTMKYSPK